jgi:hypothetical protein
VYDEEDFALTVFGVILKSLWCSPFKHLRRSKFIFAILDIIRMISFNHFIVNIIFLQKQQRIQRVLRDVQESPPSQLDKTPRKKAGETHVEAECKGVPNLITETGFELLSFHHIGLEPPR